MSAPDLREAIFRNLISLISEAGQKREGRIGFWSDGSAFSLLPHPRDHIDLTWDPRERAAVISYLRWAPDGPAYAGSSWCRLGCYGGKMHSDMGSCDVTDGVYTWPSGYLHYIERHGVRPPAHFVQHVLSKRRR